MESFHSAENLAIVASASQVHCAVQRCGRQTEAADVQPTVQQLPTVRSTIVLLHCVQTVEVVVLAAEDESRRVPHRGRREATLLLQLACCAPRFLLHVQQFAAVQHFAVLVSTADEQKTALRETKVTFVKPSFLRLNK